MIHPCLFDTFFLLRYIQINATRRHSNYEYESRPVVDMVYAAHSRDPRSYKRVGWCVSRNCKYSKKRNRLACESISFFGEENSSLQTYTSSRSGCICNPVLVSEHDDSDAATGLQSADRMQYGEVKMQNSLTTNDVRRILENAGAVCPGRRAVEMVAYPIRKVNGVTFWEMQLPLSIVTQAVSACTGLQGEESYQAFRAACCGNNN